MGPPTVTRFVHHRGRPCAFGPQPRQEESPPEGPGRDRRGPTRRGVPTTRVSVLITNTDHDELTAGLRAARQVARLRLYALPTRPRLPQEGSGASSFLACATTRPFGR